MIDYELAESYYRGVAGSATLAETSRIPRIVAERGRVAAGPRTALGGQAAMAVQRRRLSGAGNAAGTVCARHLKVAAPDGASGSLDRGNAGGAAAPVAPQPVRAAASGTREAVSSVPIISVVSASGGTGRSTIALLAAYLCARAGLATVLIEGDLQFGDYAFWLGLDDRAPALGDADVEAVELADNLRLFKAPLLPEAAEEVSDGVAAALPRLVRAADVVIADTGAFWNGLTANLLLSSALFFMVVDRRPSSIMDAVKAAELCTRIGVPALRMVPVYNRWSSRALIGADEARKALDADDIYCIPEGKRAVEELLGKGDVGALVESENPAVLGVERLLEDVLPRVGHLYRPGERLARRKRRGGLA